MVYVVKRKEHEKESCFFNGIIFEHGGNSDFSGGEEEGRHCAGV